MFLVCLCVCLSNDVCMSLKRCLFVFVAFEDDVGVNLSQKLSTFEDNISLGKKVGIGDFVQRLSILSKISK